MGDVFRSTVVVTLFVYFVIMDGFAEKSLAKALRRKVIFLETNEN